MQRYQPLPLHLIIPNKILNSLSPNISQTNAWRLSYSWSIKIDHQTKIIFCFKGFQLSNSSPGPATTRKIVPRRSRKLKMICINLYLYRIILYYIPQIDDMKLIAYYINLLFYKQLSKLMEQNITNLQKLIDKATSSVEQYPQELNQSILTNIKLRVDMPKHAMAAISKRMVLKNKNVLINIFTLLEYLAYECELSLYSQISTKQFLFKTSGLLMNKDIDPAVKDKIMQTVYCWEELFRPHEDLLPLFFTFYAGLLRNNFEIPHGYKSPYRPSKLKEYRKKEQSSIQQQKSKKLKKRVPEATISEQQIFEQIREKLILTNQIIDNSNPAESVKDNNLLIEMVEQVKQCQKKVNETINANPSERIMEYALATNDDIFITYRRFKDLQRNKKPQPFILTQLASDYLKETAQRNTKSTIMKKPTEKQDQKPKKKESFDIFDDGEPPKKIVQSPTKPKIQQNIMDFDYDEKPQEKPQEIKKKGDVFDLLGDDDDEPEKKQAPKSSNYDEMLGGFSFQSEPSKNHSAEQNKMNGLNLDMDDYKTDADIKNREASLADRLGELTFDFLKKSN